MLGVCQWTDVSLNTYKFEVFDINTKFNPVSGIYIFCILNRNGNWHPLYIGEANDLSSRFQRHHKLPQAILMGATHFHILRFDGGEMSRKRIESDLIKNYYPPLNEKT